MFTLAMFYKTKEWTGSEFTLTKTITEQQEDLKDAVYKPADKKK